MNRIWILLILSILFAGCGTFGPQEGSPEFYSAVNAAVDPSEVILSHSAEWYPNRFGFNDIGFGMNATPVFGIFVLTPDDVIFLVWNDGSSVYVIGTSIERQEINQAIVDSYGRNRRLVLLAGDRINSFALLHSGRGVIDVAATEAVAEILGNSSGD